MTPRRKIIFGLALLALPHVLYELRVSLISAASVLPPVTGDIVPVPALGAAGLHWQVALLSNLPFILFTVFCFAGACLIGSRLFTWGIRPEGFETRPWTESTADFSFALAVGFHVTLMGPQTPWLRTGGHPAWALVPGFLSALGVWLAVRPPSPVTAPDDAPAPPVPADAPPPLLQLPLLILLGGLLSMPVIRLIAETHGAWHLETRIRLAADPGLAIWPAIAGRSMLLILWTTGLLLTLWRAALRDWKGAALAAGFIVLSGGGAAAMAPGFRPTAGSVGRDSIGGVALKEPENRTLVLLHDEDDVEKRITARVLPAAVWSSLLQMPLPPIDPIRFRPDGGSEMRPAVTDILPSSAAVNVLPETLDRGLWFKCSELHRAAACEQLLARISHGLRHPDYDGWLAAFLDENRFRLSEGAKAKIEAALDRQTGTEQARIEVRVMPAGMKPEGAVLFALEEGDQLPPDGAGTDAWMSFVERNLVARVPMAAGSHEPAVFENIPPGRYVAGLLVRTGAARYVIEQGNPIGPFDVGPGSVTLPPVALGVRALNGSIGVPATGP